MDTTTMSNENLDELFDITDELTTEVVEVEEGELMPEDSERAEEVDTDYQYTRTNYYDLIEKGTSAIESSLQIAQEGQHPRAYEVTAQLLKNVGELNRDLMELQITVDKLKGTSKPTKVTNNTMFVGSTKELQQMLKQRQTENE
jgi:hypothetical protein